MRAAVALGLTLVAVLVGVVAVVSADRPRLAGTNNVFDAFPSVPLDPGQEACAQAEIVPGDTAAVRVHAQPSEGSGGPLALRLVRDGREVARGSLPGGWSDGLVDVPVRPVVARTQPDVGVCFANEGPAAITLWGYGAADERRAVRDGEELGERIRLSFVRPGRESGWDLLAVVPGRMGVGRGGWLDGWAFAGWLVAVLGTLAAVTLVAVRELRA